MSRHRLYCTAAWRRLREAQLRAHPLCRMHQELGQTVMASVVDHQVPHRGDADLFLDAANLQSLCKQCHDAHKQAQEHNRDGVLRGAGLTGQPLDLAHPWHQQGGDQKSARPLVKTGRLPTLAAPRNGRGGL